MSSFIVKPETQDHSEAELREIFDSLNKSEKFGIAFGMFPSWLDEKHHLTHNDIVELMRIRVEKGPRMVFD
jgi:hypothetical protein